MFQMPVDWLDSFILFWKYERVKGHCPALSWLPVISRYTWWEISERKWLFISVVSFIIAVITGSLDCCGRSPDLWFRLWRSKVNQPADCADRSFVNDLLQVTENGTASWIQWNIHRFGFGPIKLIEDDSIIVIHLLVVDWSVPSSCQWTLQLIFDKLTNLVQEIVIKTLQMTSHG